MTGQARAWAPVGAGVRPGTPGPSPGQSMAPLYGLEPGPSGEVRDRCVRLNGLEPGRIPVGALNRAAARATLPTKKSGGGFHLPLL